MNPNASNKALKVLDISYNSFGERALRAISEMMEVNRTLEYLGLAKNNIENEHAISLFNNIGRIPFPAD